jgi:RNA polymerase sigma-70 factor, ECF subfamily
MQPTALAAMPQQPADARRRRLEQLFADHAVAVFAFARRRTSASDADEVVSETFLVAWRRLDDVPEHERAWLLGVARRVLANRTRAETRQLKLQLRLATPVVDSAPDEAMQERVRQALDRLSPSDRDTLTLLAWEGLTPAELAVTLGCSRAAVYVRIHRARQRFAAVLSTPATDEGDRP